MPDTPIRHTIPFGTTEPQTFVVKVTTPPSSTESVLDLTGFTLAWEVTDRNGNSVTVTGTVAISDATAGEYTYTPDNQLTPALSPYQMRLKITDGGGSIFKVPSGKGPDVLFVVSP